MSSDDTLDKLNSLLLAHQEGRLSESEAKELYSILKSDPAARRRYAELQVLETALHLELMAGGTVIQSTATQADFKPSRTRQWKRWMAVSAMLAIVASTLWILKFSKPDDAGSLVIKDQERHLESVAILADALNAEWGEGIKPAAGSELAPGKYVLQKGSVMIDFHSSARMYIEGPSIIQIQSAFCVHLDEGRVRAHVPEQARGFVVSTDRLKVIDLGTEFSVQSTNSNSTVQVFRGDVQLQKADGSPLPGGNQTLSAGKGLSVDTQGNFQHIEALPLESDTFDRIQKKFGQHAQQQFQAWQKRRADWLKRPDVIAYYDFQKRDGQENQLPDHVASHSSADGAIVGAEWTTGRWTGKAALEFKRPGDRVRINISGRMDRMTLAAWIRVDSLDNRLQGLLLTDGYVEGRPHWQITSDGSLRLGIRLPDLNGRLNSSGYGTPSLFTKDRMGVWTFVSTVYDRAEKTVKHYVDGIKVSEHTLVFDQPLTIGPADIGNWGAPFDYQQQPIRNFNGRIDELIILNSASTAEDIIDLYQSGKQ